MVSIIVTVSMLLLIANPACGLNILGIFPFPGKSHFIQFKVYLQELAKRGHNVTVVSHFPNENRIPNYQDISLENEIIPQSLVYTERDFYRHILSGIFLTRYGIDSCKKLVKNQEIRDLVQRKQKFDVVVAQQLNTDCALGIAYKLDAPVVGITAGMLIHYHCKRFGVPCNPAYVLSHFLGGGMRPTLYQRIERNIVEFYYTICATFQQWVDQYTLAEYFDDIPPLEDLAREIKILLVYQSFIVNGPRLLPFNVIEVGGYHIPETKPLTNELLNFVDEAEHGVIYINFGTHINFAALSNETQEAIFGALQEFPQKVVLRYDGPTLHFDKTKMFTSNWLPQVDILGHPKTLLFISHGGISSVMEALQYNVPMVIVPFWTDQHGNAAAIEARGFGVEIDLISKQSITSALKKVLDPVFRAKASQVSKAFRDRPMSPLDTAVYWTEFAARNANFTFRTPAADTPIYQHLYLDVAVVLIFISLTAIYLTKIIFSLVISTIKWQIRVLFGEKKSKSV